MSNLYSQSIKAVKGRKHSEAEVKLYWLTGSQLFCFLLCKRLQLRILDSRFYSLLLTGSRNAGICRFEVSFKATWVHAQCREESGSNTRLSSHSWSHLNIQDAQNAWNVFKWNTMTPNLVLAGLKSCFGSKTKRKKCFRWVSSWGGVGLIVFDSFVFLHSAAARQWILISKVHLSWKTSLWPI